MTMEQRLSARLEAQHENVPESLALSPSAPRKGTSSAPISRRKLHKNEHARGETPHMQRKADLKSPGNLVASSRKERLWRERLASTKALLGVGTQDACMEVHARSQMSPARHHPFAHP